MRTFKKVLITGGAQRIGSSITKHLASNGLDVAIQYNTSYSNVKKLENLLKKIQLILKPFNLILKVIVICSMKNFLKKLKGIWRRRYFN